MRTRRIIILTIIVLALGTVWPVFAQSTWAGTAVVGRAGEFPPGGYYAASNTFPLNTMIDVTNDATGETVRVIVVRRIDDPGVFLLLSEEAADALEIRRGSRPSVSAQPVRMPGLTAIGPNQDLPYHPDPDVNPAASLGDPNLGVLMPAEVEDDPEPESEQEEITERAPLERPPERGPELLVLTPDLELPPVDDPAILEQPIPRPVPPRTAPLVLTPALPSDPNGEHPRLVRPVEPGPPTDPLQARIQEIDRTLAGERISMMPIDRVREPDKISKPGEEIAPIPETPVLPIVTDRPPGPAAPALPEIDLPLVAVKDDMPEIAPAPVRPERIPDDAMLALEPAEFRAPEVPDTDEPDPDPDPDTEPEPSKPEPPRITREFPDLPLVKALERGSFYVQVAAMSNPESAARAVSRLNGESTGFPVAVTTQRNGDREVYRVFVGPLAEDERGIALYTVRSRGFRDAFVRAEQPAE